MNLTIRPASENDFPAMWEIFHAVIQGGDKYVFAPDTTKDDARAYWFGPGIMVYVAEDRGWILGMYKLSANQRDFGSHIANASFMVAPGQQGQGIGTLMGKHCLKEAKNAGFSAMQFNYVISTNESAIRLWNKLGFRIVGTIPQAYRHVSLGLVDIHIMYRSLEDIPE